MDTSYPVLAVTLATTMGYLYYRKYSTTNTHPVLNPTEFRPFKLIKITNVTHNVNIYTFEIPKNKTLGLDVGKHLQLLLELNNKQILRSYTPISSINQKNYFELIIKTYENGIVTKYLSKLLVGEKVYFKGPRGSFKYSDNMCSCIGMICGGTGIAPMYQLIKYILSNKNDKTTLKLIYGNQSIDDILLKDELDQLLAQNPNTLEICYLVDKIDADNTWDSNNVGYVNEYHIEKYMPKPSNSIKILVCGPPMMVKKTCDLLQKMNYDKSRTLSKIEDMVFKF